MNLREALITFFNILFIYFKYFIYYFLFQVYEYITCMYVCTIMMSKAHKDQKRVLDSLELELQTVVSLHEKSQVKSFCLIESSLK